MLKITCVMNRSTPVTCR